MLPSYFLSIIKKANFNEHKFLNVFMRKNIDFKVDLEKDKPKSWLKSVSAFANTNGGILLFGVRDEDRKLIGFLKSKKINPAIILEKII